MGETVPVPLPPRAYNHDDIPIQIDISFLKIHCSGIVGDVLSLFLSDLNSHNNG
jgi:hypothetical protein